MLDTPDGAQLRVATFPAPRQDAQRGTVFLTSGRSEFIEKYFEVIQDLQNRDFNVVTMDWRGQGLSSRLLPVSEKGHITTFETYTADLRFVMDQVVRPKYKTPYLLMTHSMGGVPALQVLAEDNTDFIAAVLSAPMTRLFNAMAMRLFARALSRSAVKVGASRQSIPGVKEHSLEFDGNILTSDPIRHKRFRELQAAAPNATIGSPTYGWMKAATDAIDKIHDTQYMKNLHTPVLIVSAENDQLIDSTDHNLLANNNTNIHCLTINNAFHEILMEQDIYRNEFWAAFDDFIDPILNDQNA